MSTEDRCRLVCSRGLLKKCTIHSQNPQSSCGWDTGYLQPLKEVANQRPGMSIYVCSDALPTFVEQILPHIQYPFYLLTGDSDLSVPYEVLNPILIERLLESPYLLRWGAQNVKHFRSPKLVQIPIGLDYHSIASARAPQGWLAANESRIDPGAQEAFLTQLRQTAPGWPERICKVYTNAQHRIDRFGDRTRAITQIPGNLLVLEPTLIPRSEVWRNYTKYAFVASPHGNGIDCHRTWEALCCGAIPIICGDLLTDLFDDLPVLRVASWSDVTQELLQKTVTEFSGRTIIASDDTRSAASSRCTFNYDKLTLQYWFDKVTGR